MLLQLKPAAWAEFGSSKLYTLTRNLTIRSTFKPYGLMDFQLLERKVLVDAGVTVTFSSVVLQNVRWVGPGQLHQTRSITSSSSGSGSSLARVVLSVA